MADEKTTTRLIVDSSDLVAQCTDFIDRHVKEFRFAVVGIGLLGMAITIRSLRIFGRFHRVDRIPKDYFKKNISLDGIVKNVDSDTGTLLVEHIPIIRIFASKPTDPLLRVRLGGVRVSQVGTQWLKTTTENDRIRFTLLESNADKEAESIVNSMEGFLKKRCVNLEVVRLGMGRVENRSENLRRNKQYRKLYVELLAAEADAAKNRRGMWFTSEDSSSESSSSSSFVRDISRTVLNKIATTVKSSIQKKPASN